MTPAQLNGLNSTLIRERLETREAGIEDYLFIGGDRLSRRKAAQRLGVSVRTIDRYRAELRQRAEAPR